MAVQVIPDVVQAIIERLEAESAITTLTGSRISRVMRSTWAMPTHAITIRLVGDGGGDDYESGRLRSRLDIECYGPTPEQALLVWRTMHPYLVPNRGSGRKVAFKQSGCRIDNIVKEGGPGELIDDTTNYPFVLATYIVNWLELPV